MPVCLGAEQDVCLVHSGLTIISWWELILKQSLLRAPNLRGVFPSQRSSWSPKGAVGSW